MSERTKKSSLLTAFRQKLIDKLAAVPKVAEDEATAEAVRQQRIAWPVLANAMSQGKKREKHADSARHHALLAGCMHLDGVL